MRWLLLAIVLLAVLTVPAMAENPKVTAEPDPNCHQNQVVVHVLTAQGYNEYTFCGWKATWLAGRTVLRLTGPNGERMDFSAPLEVWYFPPQ